MNKTSWLKTFLTLLETLKIYFLFLIGNIFKYFENHVFLLSTKKVTLYLLFDISMKTYYDLIIIPHEYLKTQIISSKSSVFSPFQCKW